VSQHVRDVTTAEFPQAVLQRSQEVPVVVDFWAEWCGPCKVLGPVLEKLADEMQGDFELVKVDIDANQQLAVQFGVQGIPMVMAFRNGAPASQFSGAYPEREVRQWLAAVLPSDADKMVDDARDAILDGEMERAEALLRSVLETTPDHLDAGTSLASLLIARGESEEALIVLGKLSPTAEVERLQAAARVTSARGNDLTELEARVAADPADDAAMIELARALAAHSEFEPALDRLLAVVRAKRESKDEARKAMLDIFEILGDEHPLTPAYRRQLSSALF
jgi:putative thioredoxin